jgi:hypothetical protein
MFTTHLLDLTWGLDPHVGARGPTVDIFYVYGGRSQISCFDTSQGARCRCFLALMVGALGSLAPAPPTGPAVDTFYIDGGCCRISVSTRQGVRHQCFITLMVDAPESPTMPPKGPATIVL